MANHPIVHIEIPSRDLTESGKFYSEIFGWKTEGIPAMNYMTWQSMPQQGGGFSPLDGEAVKPGDVLVYIDTDDIEGTLARIEKAGGKTIRARDEVPGMGWFAIFEDPTGNRIALWKAAMPQA